nr:chorismate synthase [Akkermansia muciniphila]
MSSSFGQVFRISTWGESHGTGVGVVIDGCPSLVPVMEEDIQRELDRRRPGQSDIVTPPQGGRPRGNPFRSAGRQNPGNAYRHQCSEQGSPLFRL